MKRIGRTLLAGALLALGGSAAQGATLATAPIPNNVPVNHTMFCDIVNIDDGPLTATIEIMDLNGVVVNGPLGPLLLQPFQAFAFSNNTGTGAWCRFTVQGSAKKFRALAVYDDGSDYTVSIPAQ